MMMRKAFILGCGYTGLVLARRLEGKGITVGGTRATEDEQGAGPALRRLDLRQGAAPLLTEAQGAVIYYMIPTGSRAYDPERRPHLQLMDNALAGLSGLDIKGLIYLSSTSVYGDPKGGWVDELTVPEPRSPWGHMRLELEHHLTRFGQDRGVPTCVVRLPEIYGPGRGPVARLRKGYTLRFPNRYSNRIHVEDLALVLEQLGQRLEPPLLLVADDHPTTSAEVYDLAASLLGLEAVPRGEEVEGDENRRALLSESKRCRTDLLKGWLGRKLKYPSYREGLASTL